MAYEESDEIAARTRRRSVDSFFADRHADPATPRICRGTSCEQLGAEPLARAHPAARPVHCIGHCDRGPAWLDAEGRVRIGAAALPRAEPPEIRCLARRAIVSERIGRGDFSALADARAAGVYTALEAALRQPQAALIDALEASGERGRGGAGFGTGAKWRTAAAAPPGPRHAIANGDEGDPGSFIDRVLLERDPHAVIEGLLLCARAIGAREAIVYVRSEYPQAQAAIGRALTEARAAGLVGARILGADFDCEIRCASGEGSYVCGEETALLEALEGRRGEVRLRPPYPSEQGLFGHPTVVQNVETLVNVPAILREGPAAYRALGSPDSAGTKALCLSGVFARPGIVEVEFGTSLAEVIALGEGVRGGGAPGAVLLGGPMGNLLYPDEWEVPICYEALRARGIDLGHGGLVALPPDFSPRDLLLHLLGFMAGESCGRCAPCALGSQRALQLARAVAAAADRDRLDELLGLIAQTSLCAFGQSLPGPLRKLLARSPLEALRA